MDEQVGPQEKGNMNVESQTASIVDHATDS